MKENLYKWLDEQIEDKEDYQNDYEQGLHDAYIEVEDKIELGAFDELVYVKLKPQYNIVGLNHDKEYEADSVFGGEYFKIINNKIGDFQYYERYKFEVVKVYDYYNKMVVNKKYIDKLNEKLSKGVN